MAPIYLPGTVAEAMWWVGRLRSLCGGWLYSDYNASLSSNWTELDWTGTELGNVENIQRGVVYKFLGGGGCRTYSSILGGV